MHIRRSTIADVPIIMEIIEDAKALLASQNIDQWQNGYPNAEQITNDIANKESYIVVSANNTIIATTMFTTRPEPTYKKVIDGSWQINESEIYGVIHRLAVNKNYRGQGIAKFSFQHFHNQLKVEGIKSLKIDTHEDNLGMQSLIKEMGYHFCGIIYTSYGAKRLAFEKIIE